VPAFIDLVVVDQVGIRPFCPTPGGWIEFVREDAYGNRDRGWGHADLLFERIKSDARLPIYQTKVSAIPLYRFPPSSDDVTRGGLTGDAWE
jgi:hypothetical protein